MEKEEKERVEGFKIETSEALRKGSEFKPQRLLSEPLKGFEPSHPRV